MRISDWSSDVCSSDLGVNATLLAGWSLAALLFAAALLAPLGGGLRRGAPLASAAMTVAAAVTLYSHDVMALPQLCPPPIAGPAVGRAPGRGGPPTALASPHPRRPA